MTAPLFYIRIEEQAALPHNPLEHDPEKACPGLATVMPGTRVRPSAGPSVNLVPGIHAFAKK
jgi:hypothetical protein